MGSTTSDPAMSSSALVPAFLGGANLALRSSSPHATGELFSKQLDDAVDRQGGERVIERRLDELADARRSDRREGFERYRGQVADSRRREDSLKAEERPLAPGVREDDVLPAAPAQRSPTEQRPSLDRATQPSRSSSSSAELSSARNQSGPSSPQLPGGAPSTASAPSALPTGAPGTANVASAGTGTSAGNPSPRGAPNISAVLVGPRGEKLLEALAAERAKGADPTLLERAEQVLKQIRIAIQPRAKRVTLELSPNDLGRLSIRMTLRKGELSTVVRAESPQTLELLELRAPELRSMLAEHGLDAAHMEFELGFGAGRQAGRERHARQELRSLGSASRPRMTSVSVHAPPAVRAGGIDTYA